MRKLICVFLLSVTFALACAGDVEAFKKAMKVWIKAHPDASDLFKQQTITYQYFDSISVNQSCATEIENQFDKVTQQAADQWEVDKSQLGAITTNLLNFVFPSLIVKYKRCANQTTFSNDEKNFDTATDQVLSGNPQLSKTYNEFSAEIGFLTKGQLPLNETCAQIASDFVELYRLSGVAQYAKNADAFTIIAKIVYASTPTFIKRTQKCLTGQDFSKFNSAFTWYFNTYPTQQELYDQLDDMIGTLTKILPHDNECAKKINDKFTSRLQDAYASFGNGTATIGELAGKFLYTYLPEGINEARECLTP